MPYPIIIERGSENFSAYAPDFPGCIAAAATKQEATDLMKEALEMHIKDLRERSETIPKPTIIHKIEMTA